MPHFRTFDQRYDFQGVGQAPTKDTIDELRENDPPPQPVGLLLPAVQV